ncbi:hypothetical protein SAMN05428978_105617 [Nitrosomonas sp. Nm34]|nr:hypothetical protein SAMN05428978_105617 [Nitrosomonas sp. Nm34]
MNKGLIFYTKKIRRLSDAYISFISVLAEHSLSIACEAEQSPCITGVLGRFSAFKWLML